MVHPSVHAAMMLKHPGEYGKTQHGVLKKTTQYQFKPHEVNQQLYHLPGFLESNHAKGHRHEGYRYTSNTPFTPEWHAERQAAVARYRENERQKAKYQPPAKKPMGSTRYPHLIERFGERELSRPRTVQEQQKNQRNWNTYQAQINRERLLAEYNKRVRRGHNPRRGSYSDDPRLMSKSGVERQLRESNANGYKKLHKSYNPKYKHPK